MRMKDQNPMFLVAGPYRFKTWLRFLEFIDNLLTSVRKASKSYFRSMNYLGRLLSPLIQLLVSGDGVVRLLRGLGPDRRRHIG